MRKDTVSAISAIIRGHCDICANRAACKKSCGVMFGFCEIDFRADEKRIADALRTARRLNKFARHWFNDYGEIATAEEEAGGRSALIAEDAIDLLEGTGRGHFAQWLEECQEMAPEGEDAAEIEYLLRAVRRF